jgi:hypothetical protein
VRRFLAVVLFLAGCALPGVPTAAASPSAKYAEVQIESAVVGGQSLKDTTPTHPLRLVPGESVDVSVQVANHGSQPIRIRHVELSGRVLGLVFYNYLANVDFQVPVGGTETVRYQLELSGLRRQGVGLMRGELDVTDADSNSIASTEMVSDIRGSYFSVYGLFGIALLILTALAATEAALAIARHRLSNNRFLRGVRLLMPGIGVGLLLLFTASATRIWVPRTTVWLVVAAITAVLFFACGYLSPTPRDEDDEDDDDLDDVLVLDDPDEDTSTTTINHAASQHDNEHATAVVHDEPTLVPRSEPTLIRREQGALADHGAPD